MIAKANNITHGSNAVRYSADKELAEIVKVGHLPEGLTTSSIWSRMMLHQAQFKEKLQGHRRIKNTSIRIELSPAKEETEGWTMADWQKLADDFWQTGRNSQMTSSESSMPSVSNARRGKTTTRILTLPTASMSCLFTTTARARYSTFISMPTASTWTAM